MAPTAGRPAPAAPLPARIAAAAVHAFTAVGVVLALAMVHFAYLGEVEVVLWLFLAAMVIDGTDGFLARRLRVAERLPRFDGELLDNIVDYLTYAFAPMVLLWSAGFLPAGWGGGAVAAVVLLASCYQFCRTDAKTADHFFRGFPSYWNVAAFYVVVLGLTPATTTAVLLVLSVAAFVPVLYLYPSRTAPLWRLTMVLTALWFVSYGAIVVLMPQPPAWLVAASVLYVAYYVGASVVLTYRGSRPHS